MMYGFWDIRHAKQSFLSFWVIFCPFTFLKPEKSKFWKNEKSAWRYYHSTLTYHKWWSYDVRFLRYEAQQTEFFVVLDYFLSFYPSKQPRKSKFWKNEKNAHRYYHFTHMKIVWCMFLEIWSTTDITFPHFGPFFVLLPSNNPENQNF